MTQAADGGQKQSAGEMVSTPRPLSQGPVAWSPIFRPLYLASGQLCRDIPGACEESCREKKVSVGY